MVNPTNQQKTCCAKLIEENGGEAGAGTGAAPPPPRARSPARPLRAGRERVRAPAEGVWESRSMQKSPD